MSTDSLKETFNGRPVLDAGAGQCLHCGRRVTRVLLGGFGFKREWVTVDFNIKGYLWHECGPQPEPTREAA